MTSPHGADQWDARYREKDAIWSGNVNTQLVAEATSLTPGAALDVGCGEGADSVWLAQQGWDVTGVDISTVAIERARAHAESLGLSIDFQVRDLVESPPEPLAYDLVSAHFFHFADMPIEQVYTSLGAAVSPGGHLLVVGHDPVSHSFASHQADLFTADRITALFPGDDWTVLVAETRERRSLHHGEMTDLTDVVVLLRRADA